MLFALVAVVVAAAPLIEPVHDAEGTPGVKAVFDVDADADAVLELLWDVDRFLLIFPDIKELHVERRPDDRTVQVRFVVDAVVAKPTYTLLRKIDRGQRTISWVNVAGDLDKIVGHWRIAPRASSSSAPSCTVTYQSVVDVGVPGANGMYRGLVMGKLEEMIGRVQKAATAPVRKVPSTMPTTTPTPTP